MGECDLALGPQPVGLNFPNPLTDHHGIHPVVESLPILRQPIVAISQLALRCLDSGMVGLCGASLCSGQGSARLVQIGWVEESGDPFVELRHDGGLPDVDVLRVVEAGHRSAIDGELAAVVMCVVVHVALHPVSAESAVHAPAQDVGPLRRPGLPGRRSVSARGHLSLRRCEGLRVDDRLVGLLRRPNPLVAAVPAHPRQMTLCHVLDVDEDLVAALAVPDLAAGVARVHQDRPDRDLRPRTLVPVAVPGRVVRAGGGDAITGEVLRDGEVATAGDVLAEDPLHDRRRCGVHLELVEALAVRRLARVWMRACVGQPVAVGRAAAEEPTLVLCLSLHGRAHADLDPIPLTLRHAAVEGHDEIVSVGAGVDLAADLRDPQLDAVVDEHGERQAELVAVEGTSGLADHDCVEATVRRLEDLEQRRRLWTALPWKRPTLSDVEELGNDHTAGGLDDGLSP